MVAYCVCSPIQPPPPSLSLKTKGAQQMCVQCPVLQPSPLDPLPPLPPGFSAPLQSLVWFLCLYLPNLSCEAPPINLNGSIWHVQGIPVHLLSSGLTLSRTLPPASSSTRKKNSWLSRVLSLHQPSSSTGAKARVTLVWAQAMLQLVARRPVPKAPHSAQSLSSRRQ